MNLAEAVSKDRGQPATVRIGVVSSLSPLRIKVQATEMVNVGVLSNNYVPVVGHTVVLLGQSAVSADGSSWLLLGQVLPSASGVALAATVGMAIDSTSVSTASTAYVPLTGSFNVGTAFVAPASGRVMVHMRASTAPAASAQAWTSARIGTGATVGAGTVIQSGNDAIALMATVTGDSGTFFLLGGLTPGVTYNAEMQHRTTTGTSFWARRQLVVEPVP